MAKNISEIDKNLVSQTVIPQGTKLYDVRQKPFVLYGLDKPAERGVFERAPIKVQQCEEIGEGARLLMKHTSGGRVRFATDSKTIAIRTRVTTQQVMPHMTAVGVRGFDMYACCDGRNLFAKAFVPPEKLGEDGLYENVHQFEQKKMRDITINFPLYSGVTELYIALDEDAELLPPKEYSYLKPVVFYGSSLDHGCSASRPGMSFPAILSRMLDCDYINLGFSGSDKGESALAEYIASLDMSVFVYNYGYNSPSLEYFADTYYPFYKIVREKNPDLPIIMVSVPVIPYIKEENRMKTLNGRRNIVMKAYQKAYDEGDRNVWFIDGFNSLGYDEFGDGTVDGTHPSDLGLYNMAQQLYPVIKEALER